MKCKIYSAPTLSFNRIPSKLVANWLIQLNTECFEVRIAVTIMKNHPNTTHVTNEITPHGEVCLLTKCFYNFEDIRTWYQPGTALKTKRKIKQKRTRVKVLFFFFYQLQPLSPCSRCLKVIWGEHRKEWGSTHSLGQNVKQAPSNKRPSPPPSLSLIVGIPGNSTYC